MKDLYKIYSIVVILLIFGLVMLTSATTFLSYQNKYFKNNPYYFLTKQLIWIFLGIIVGIIFSNIDLRKIKEDKYLFLMILSIILLIAVLFTKPVNGARRWFRLFGISFQPSELAEVSMILYLSKKFSNIKDQKDIIVPIFLSFIVIGLIVLEPNISCALTLMIILTVIMIYSAVPAGYIISILILGGILSPVIITKYPHALIRIKMFFNNAPNNSQISNSVLAIANGGLLGRGLGAGQMKLLFIPEIQSDFIFATIAEETGFLGSVTIILIYVILFKLGKDISKKNLYVNRFFYILAFSISFTLFIKAMLHISICLQMFPSTGVTLPFISYGGTSMLMNLTMLGILANIERYNEF
ncbi:MAG: FtsW/RodA/SpoVE family cell cycle protein [bacterium]|nr:FtsW/RodA/SpoVE family cell cycle protein [bacterium]